MRLSDDEVETLLHARLRTRSTRSPSTLKQQTVTDDARLQCAFEIDPFRKYCLLNGLDDIGLTLRHEAELTTLKQSTMRSSGWHRRGNDNTGNR